MGLNCNATNCVILGSCSYSLVWTILPTFYQAILKHPSIFRPGRYVLPSVKDWQLWALWSHYLKKKKKTLENLKNICNSGFQMLANRQYETVCDPWEKRKKGLALWIYHLSTWKCFHTITQREESDVKLSSLSKLRRQRLESEESQAV